MGNVEEYLQDRHGLGSLPTKRDSTTPPPSPSPNCIPGPVPSQIDGYTDTDHYLLTDDDLVSGAAFGTC